MDENVRRCISWIAVSSKPQTEKESPDEQRVGNRDAIEMLGGKLVAELVVDGESREFDGFEDACKSLEAYAQLQKIMQERGADIIVCRDMTRLGRSLGLLGQTVSRLHAAGIAVYSRTAPPTTLDAREQSANQGATFMLAIESALAQVELQKFRNNHTFGMLGRAKRGLFPRGKKFGWRATPDKRIEIVEEQAAAIRFAFDAYVHSGQAVDEICREMNRRGFVTATGVQWTAATFKPLLEGAWIYAGYIEYNKYSKTGRPYYRGKAAWPPIIDEKLAIAVVEERKRRAASRRAVESPYLFSGVGECEQCGGNILASSMRREKRRYRCRNLCRGSHTTEPKLVAGMLAFLDSLAQQADVDIGDPAPDITVELQAQLAQIDKRIAALAEQRKRHARNNAMSLLDDSEFAELMRETADARLALEGQRTDILARLTHVETAEERMRRIADIRESGKERLLTGDIPTRNAWLRANFRVIINHNRITQVHIKSSGM